jgi:hypothetical protein
MRLPAGRLHDLGERRAAFALEQAQDLGLLAAVAGCGGLTASFAGFPLGSLGRRLGGGLGLLASFAAAFGFLVGLGAAAIGAVSAEFPPSRLWIAFQIRLTADFRFVNFLTGVRPGIPFQTSISRLAGQLATRLASSCWLANISPSKSACWLPSAVMLFSASIVYVVISLFPLCRLLRS